ncbi:MAG TPA: protoporphyrinogen oxidase [Solirubrobacteraceae bacterium]
MSERLDVAIVGGGIAGLAAAYRVAGSQDAAVARDADRPGNRGDQAEFPSLHVTLFEADERLGGKIRTETFAGRPLDVGAEALLARMPAGLELCHELGLEHDLVAPASDQPFVWTDRLRPLPPRLMAGVPDGSRAMIASGILSPAGLARAGLDLIIPARPPKQDVSIGSIVRHRLGAQVLERLIDPLLGGIHAGSCDELSMRATAPQLEAALRKRRSLVRGLRAISASPPPAPASPTFLTLSHGLQEIVRALRERLTGTECRTGARLERLQALAGGGAELTLAGGETLSAKAVILAVPAFAAASILEQSCPAAAAELAEIPYASVATIALSYPAGAFPRPLAGSGFLVMRGAAGRTITACTWSSAKWPHLAGDTVLLKCSAGQAGERRALELDDEQLIAAVRADLARAMGLQAAPLEGRVFRFERALPQYTVGHLERTQRIDDALQILPGVRLCGAAYRGVGVAACIRDGQNAGDAILAALRPGSGARDQRPTASLAATYR